MRRGTKVGLVVAALLLLSSGCAEDLRTLGGDHSWAYGINDAGTVVGVADDADQVPKPFRRTDDENEELPLLAGFTTGEAKAINDAGDAVGWVGNAAGDRRAVKWPAAGGVVNLGGLGGKQSQVNDINAAGVAVGWSTVWGSAARHATVWDPAVGHVVALAGGESPISSAVAVNDAGRIVGERGGGFPVVWTGPDHTIVDLDTHDVIEIADIDGDGTVVGTWLSAVGGVEEFRRRAVWWSPQTDGTYGPMAILESRGSIASAIEDGVIVGGLGGRAHVWIPSTKTSHDLASTPGSNGSHAEAIAGRVPVGVQSFGRATSTWRAARFDRIRE